MNKELLMKAEAGDYEAAFTLCKELLIEEGIYGPQYLHWCITVAEETDPVKILESRSLVIMATKLGDMTTFVFADETIPPTREDWLDLQDSQIDILVKGTIYKYCKGALKDRINTIIEEEPEFLCRLGVSFYKLGYPAVSRTFIDEAFKRGYRSAGVVIACIIASDDELLNRHVNELHEFLSIIDDDTEKNDLFRRVLSRGIFNFSRIHYKACAL